MAAALDTACEGADTNGVVVIGRNEGERLRRCLDSVMAPGCHVVYVDSGSTDSSVAMAQAKGVAVVALDMSLPFTAARARNAGLARLREFAPSLRYVQFVDGDCEVISGWIAVATRFLQDHADVAAVCGRLRERHPERSVYNRLCDAEWDRPPGAADAVGGIAMLRVEAFVAVGGYREDLVAGEEPELCARLRQRHWRVWRLPDAMAWHDAAMLHFGQWWKRTRRIGFGYGHAMALAATPEDRRAAWRRVARAWVWAFAWPLVTAVALIAWGWPALALLLAYPLQGARTALGLRGSASARAVQSSFLMLGKFGELAGQCQYLASRRSADRASPSFDYKA